MHMEGQTSEEMIPGSGQRWDRSCGSTHIRKARMPGKWESVSPIGRWGHAGLRREAACGSAGRRSEHSPLGDVCEPAQLEAESEEGHVAPGNRDRLHITKGL